MFCAQCGAAVAQADQTCPGCGTSLRPLGSVRMTSRGEPATSLDEIFPEFVTPPVTQDVEPEADRAPRHGATRSRALRGPLVPLVVVIALMVLFFALTL